VVGYYEDGKLISAGGVGTGFTNQMLVEMVQR
jgi:ATP-dependent DNA ligase